MAGSCAEWRRDTTPPRNDPAAARAAHPVCGRAIRARIRGAPTTPGRPDAILPAESHHPEGSARRGGDTESPADAACRADPAPRLRPVHLDAGRAAGGEEDRDDR